MSWRHWSAPCFKKETESKPGKTKRLLNLEPAFICCGWSSSELYPYRSDVPFMVSRFLEASVVWCSSHHPRRSFMSSLACICIYKLPKASFIHLFIYSFVRTLVRLFVHLFNFVFIHLSFYHLIDLCDWAYYQLTAKLFNWNFHSLDVVSLWRDHNFKWLKIIQIRQNVGQRFWHIPAVDVMLKTWYLIC